MMRGLLHSVFQCSGLCCNFLGQVILYSKQKDETFALICLKSPNETKKLSAKQSFRPHNYIFYSINISGD